MGGLEYRERNNASYMPDKIYTALVTEGEGTDEHDQDTTEWRWKISCGDPWREKLKEEALATDIISEVAISRLSEQDSAIFNVAPERTFSRSCSNQSRPVSLHMVTTSVMFMTRCSRSSRPSSTGVNHIDWNVSLTSFYKNGCVSHRRQALYSSQSC